MRARGLADDRPTLAMRRARVAVAAVFFANGCWLGSWVPHLPDVKLWHGLSDAVLGLALLAIAAVQSRFCRSRAPWSRASAAGR